MAAIGVGLVWLSYWWGISGFSLVKGYNNNVLALANPVRPPAWTTQCYVGTNIFPSGHPDDSGACNAGGGQAPGGAGRDYVPVTKGKCAKGYTWNAQLGACVPRNVGPKG